MTTKHTVNLTPDAFDQITATNQCRVKGEHRIDARRESPVPCRFTDGDRERVLLVGHVCVEHGFCYGGKEPATWSLIFCDGEPIELIERMVRQVEDALRHIPEPEHSQYRTSIKNRLSPLPLPSPERGSLPAPSSAPNGGAR